MKNLTHFAQSLNAECSDSPMEVFFTLGGSALILIVVVLAAVKLLNFII